MRAGVEIRTDHSADDLRRLARRSDDADQTRRLLALSVIVDGGSRGDAARTGGVGLQVIRDWVLRCAFRAHPDRDSDKIRTGIPGHPDKLRDPLTLLLGDRAAG